MCIAEVSKHLANEQHRAAVKIQAHWKGYCTRHGLTSRRVNVQRMHAATVIQRTVTDAVSVLFVTYVLSFREL